MTWYGWIKVWYQLMPIDFGLLSFGTDSFLMTYQFIYNIVEWRSFLFQWRNLGYVIGAFYEKEYWVTSHKIKTLQKTFRFQCSRLSNDYSYKDIKLFLSSIQFKIDIDTKRVKLPQILVSSNKVYKTYSKSMLKLKLITFVFKQ